MRRIYLWSFVIYLITGCTSNEPKETVQVNDEDDVNLSFDALNLKPGEERIFLLPAPLQVATVLKLHNVDFNAELVLEPKVAANLHSKYLKAIDLGAYVVDLGYTSIFEKNEQCTKLLKGVVDLSNNLGISEGYNEYMITRFNENKDNVDSLSYLILLGFDDANNYFRQNKDEELALSILTGCWIEGMYVACHYPGLYADSEYYAMMGQQKYYLENLIILMSRFQDDDLKDVVLRLKKLYTHFLDISSVQDMEAVGKSITPSPDFTIIMNDITSEITNIRNVVVSRND